MSIVTINSISLGEISYEYTEYKIESYLLDSTYVSCLRYIGESDKPTQPVGLSDYSFMFSNRKDIETLDLSHWNMSEAKNLNGMFCDCVSLKDISSISGWDTSNVKIMSKLFRNCYGLNDILFLKDWDMSKVTINYYMFDGCKNISIYEILCLYHHYGTNEKLSYDNLTGIYSNDDTSVIISNDLYVNLKSITRDEELCGHGRGMTRLPIAKLCKSMSGNTILNFDEVKEDITKIITKSDEAKLELSTVYGSFEKLPIISEDEYLLPSKSGAAKVLCLGGGRVYNRPNINGIYGSMENHNVIINFEHTENDITNIISESVADKLLSEGVTKIYLSSLNPEHDVTIPVADNLTEMVFTILEKADYDLEKARNIIEYPLFSDDKILVNVPDNLDGGHISSLGKMFTELHEIKQDDIKPYTGYRRPRKNEKHYF